MKTTKADVDAWMRGVGVIVEALTPLPPTSRRRVLVAAAVLLGLDAVAGELRDAAILDEPDEGDDDGDEEVPK